MAIKYTYLKDGAKFTAEELNTRVADAAEGLNTIEVDDIALGALRHEALPSIIGRPDETNPDTQLLSQDVHRGFKNTHHSPHGLFYVVNAELNYTGPSFGGRLKVNAADNINAVVLLFNMQIRRFTQRNPAPGSPTSTYTLMYPHKYNFEDLVSITFQFVVELVNPTTSETRTWHVDKSARTVSPGLTQLEIRDTSDGGLYYPMLGMSYRYDYLSNKNVAMRTIITAAEIEAFTGGGLEIDKIRVQGQPRFCASDFTRVGIEYSKVNLTALPLHARVMT